MTIPIGLVNKLVWFPKGDIPVTKVARLPLPAGNTMVAIMPCHTGANPKTRPGVGFHLVCPHPLIPIPRGDAFEYQIGVMDRDTARTLRDVLTRFLRDYREEEK